MKKITLFLALIAFSLGFSQTFTDSGGPYDMQNGQTGTTGTCGTAFEMTLPLSVAGVGTLGTVNILESVTFNATHTWNADIQVELQDPSGATTVLLIQDIGGSGDGFVNCVLQDAVGTALPTGNTTPVTGVFEPLNALSAFNGANADGTWNLLVCDDAGGDVGTVDGWSLTFAPPPSCPVPANVTAAATDVEADLSWDDVTQATLGYEWVVLDTNGDPDVDSPIDSGSTGAGVTMDTATGLSVSTTYYAYVRSNCDTDGLSNWIGPVSFTTLSGPPPANDLCDNAIAISCGTPITAQSTAAASGGSTASCIGTIGDDIWYQLTGSDVDVILTVTASVEEAQVEVYESTDGTCAGITPGTCFASAGSGENPVEVSFTAFSGTEYYIRVGNWINGDPGVVFDIEAVCTPIEPAPDCAMEPITPLDGETGVSAFGLITISWTAPATGPTPTSYDIYTGFMADGSDQGFSGNTIDTFFDGTVDAYDTTIYWSVVPLNATTPAAGCALWSFTTESAPPPPANDDCAGASELIPGVDYDANAIDDTVEGATDDAEAASCGATGPGIWYSVVVPADGNITFETGPDIATGTTTFDSVIEAFSGSCGTLTSIGCDDDGADTGLYSLLDLTGLTPGSTIYLRVWAYNGGSFDPFSVSAYNATLSIDDFDTQSLFSYYPNPVTNNLTLNAQQDIQNVVVYNMLGQQVMRAAPNAVSSEVNMSGLTTGSYFVQVTVGNTTETIRIIKN